MMATIRMPITAIQSLFPACIANEAADNLVRVGAGVLIRGVLLGDAVGLGLTVFVAVVSRLSTTEVGVGLNKPCAEGAIAMFDSANSKKRTKKLII